eukprot:8024265-Karenia_brevis.AAC.1
MVGMSCGCGHVPGWTTATKYSSVADKVHHHLHHGGWGISAACTTGTMVSTRAFGGVIIIGVSWGCMLLQSSASVAHASSCYLPL